MSTKAKTPAVSQPTLKPKKILKYKSLYESLLTKYMALSDTCLSLHQEVRSLREQEEIVVQENADKTGDVLSKLVSLANLQKKNKA